MTWVLISIIFILIIALVAAIIGIYNKNTNAICKSKRRLDGKTAIVTGGTLGMGLEIAIDFAGRGAKVIIASPFKDEGRNAVKIIKEQTGNVEVIFKLLDLSSFSSVRKFANDILKNEQRLDILINNAGILTTPEDVTLSKDGLNFLLQVNYFGHFLLSLLLLPLLKKTGKPNDKSRVVNTSSIFHNLARIDPTDLNKVKYFIWLPWQDYSNSKSLIILFTRELSKRIKDTNVIVNSLEPGGVGTTIFFELYWLKMCGKALKLLSWLFLRYFCKNVWEGAQTAIFAGVDERAGHMNGQHFKDCKVIQPRLVRNDKLAKKVWEESIRLVKISEEELNLAKV